MKDYQGKGNSSLLKKIKQFWEDGILGGYQCEVIESIQTIFSSLLVNYEKRVFHFLLKNQKELLVTQHKAKPKPRKLALQDSAR